MVGFKFNFVKMLPGILSMFSSFEKSLDTAQYRDIYLPGH
jgi:hypothetical protein